MPPTPVCAPATSPAPRRIRDLPGPRGWPLLGNLPQIERDRLHQYVERWSREYGEAFRLRVGPRELVVLSNPETVGAVLRDRPDGFQRTERLEETAREFGFSGLFSSNGAAWRRQRPMVLAGLDPAHIKAFFPTLAKVTRRLAGRWQRAAAAGTPIDLQADLMRYTVDVTAGLAFGTDMNTLESDQEIIQQHLDQVLPALFRRLYAPFPYWRLFKLPADRALDRHLAALHAAVQTFIAHTRTRLAERPELREHPTHLIEAMVAARDRDGGELSDEDVSGNVLTMLLAGEDTTANTLAWMIWLLHGHPEAAARAADEARAAFAAEAGAEGTHALLGRLGFIEACAHETLRLKPVAPLNVLQAVRDTVVGGIAVPARTVVMCLMRPAALDERHFPQAADFRPERWLGEASASSSKRVAMPFGAGPRICPGRYLALAEIKMVAAMLLDRFEIASITTPDGGPAREHLALTMSPVGLQMRLRAR